MCTFTSINSLAIDNLQHLFYILLLRPCVSKKHSFALFRVLLPCLCSVCFRGVMICSRFAVGPITHWLLSLLLFPFHLDYLMSFDSCIPFSCNMIFCFVIDCLKYPLVICPALRTSSASFSMRRDSRDRSRTQDRRARHHFGNILGADVIHTVDRSSNDLLLINKKIHRGSLVLPIMILNQSTVFHFLGLLRVHKME